MGPKKTPNIKSDLEKKETAGRNVLPDFRLSYKATVTKTVLYWHKNRHKDQWNRIRSVEINPHTHSQLIYDKRGMNTQCGKESLFNMGCWEN